MNKRLRSILCTLLAVILLAALLPAMPASAASADLIKAYESFQELLDLRESQIGQPIFDDSFYNTIPTDKRDARLAGIDGCSLLDLTNDGVQDLLVKYRVEYDFRPGGYPEKRSTHWTILYTYDRKTDSLVKIGETPFGLTKVGVNNWVANYQKDYMGVGELYLSRGNDGKVYLCDGNPHSKDDENFFGYNGMHMTKVAAFKCQSEKHIFLATGGMIVCPAEYWIDGVKVSVHEYDTRRAQYMGRGGEKIVYYDYEDFYTILSDRLAGIAFDEVNSFRDVKYTDYFARPVLWASSSNITSGVSATAFAPNMNCTRGQVVTFLWRAEGCPEPTLTENPFTDINEEDYFYKAVLWAVENGITSGAGEGIFAPNAVCSRSQIVTFLYRAMNCPEPAETANPFGDVNEQHYFYKAVLWAVENGITSGTSKTAFSPNATCTRGQVVTFLYRAANPTPDHTHTYKVVEMVNVQCGSDGYKVMKCACGDSQKIVIDFYGGCDFRQYSYVSATTEKDGSKGYICIRCGKMREPTYSAETIDLPEEQKTCSRCERTGHDSWYCPKVLTYICPDCGRDTRYNHYGWPIDWRCEECGELIPAWTCHWHD